jgi:hypothetical protein
MKYRSNFNVLDPIKLANKELRFSDPPVYMIKSPIATQANATSANGCHCDHRYGSAAPCHVLTETIRHRTWDPFRSETSSFTVHRKAGVTPTNTYLGGALRFEP